MRNVRGWSRWATALDNAVRRSATRTISVEEEEAEANRRLVAQAPRIALIASLLAGLMLLLAVLAQHTGR